MQIIKATGLGAVFISISLTGVFAAKGLNDRAKALGVILDCLSRYKSLMANTGKEINAILPVSFKELGFVRFYGEKAIITKPPFFNEEDIKLLKGFFENAGTETKSGEMQKCEMYTAAFSSRRKAAAQNARQKQKIYVVSGVCTAIGAVVFLL